MHNILVAGPLHPSGRALLDEAPGLTPHYVEETSERSLVAHIAGADAVLLRTQPITADTVNKAPKLRVVSRHGVGYDAVDVNALNARGIALSICGDVNSNTVAEHAAMLILAASRRLIRADSATRSGPWEWRNSLQSQDLFGRHLLQLGYGRIGQKIARLFTAFGMQVRAYDPFLLERGWPKGGVPPVEDLHIGLAQADVVSISIPGSDAPLLGTAELAAMKPGSILVNTARGGSVDEPALIAALESGHIAAAGLDVFQEEPLPADHPLTRLEQVILTPHIAGLTRDSAERMAMGAAQNIIDFFNGRIDPDLVVNRDVVL